MHSTIVNHYVIYANLALKHFMQYKYIVICMFFYISIFQEHMPYFRRRMVYEILTKQLMWYLRQSHRKNKISYLIVYVSIYLYDNGILCIDIHWRNYSASKGNRPPLSSPMSAYSFLLNNIDISENTDMCKWMVVHEFVLFETPSNATMLNNYQNGKILILLQW